MLRGDDMNETVLRYVIAVYDEKSMTRAAQKLFVAQPSLSQSIRLLEQDLGTSLFDRSKTPLKATEAGEIFVHWAKFILGTEQQMRQHITAIASGNLRKLVVGVSPQMCQEVLPDILQKFYSVVKGCSIIIKECSTAEAKMLLEDNGIDILVGRPNSDYENVYVIEEPVLVSVPKLFQLPFIQQGEYPFINMSALTGLPSSIYQKMNISLKW
jgi:DNA-binding transcriptional LysR family regulator